MGQHGQESGGWQGIMQTRGALWRFYVPARNEGIMMMDIIQNELGNGSQCILHIITKHIQTLEEIMFNAFATLCIMITMTNYAFTIIQCHSCTHITTCMTAFQMQLQ
jgi:hypothetical protein